MGLSESLNTRELVEMRREEKQSDGDVCTYVTKVLILTQNYCSFCDQQDMLDRGCRGLGLLCGDGVPQENMLGHTANSTRTLNCGGRRYHLPVQLEGRGAQGEKHI